MEFIDPKLQAYSEQHSTPESQTLAALNRYTQSSILKPRMLAGHLQGRFLSMMSHMIKPKRILEIGTYTGYSAICLAEGLQKDGILITIDSNEELKEGTQRFINSSGFSDSIRLVFGQAQKIIPTLEEQFDLVFIDADKENYTLYFDLVFEKIPIGGFIIADNVLWSGKVIESKPDKDTRAIMEFNHKVNTDARVENILLPVRDGMMIVRKM